MVLIIPQSETSAVGRHHNIYALYNGKLYVFGGYVMKWNISTSYRDYTDTTSHFDVFDLGGFTQTTTSVQHETITFTYAENFKLGPWGDNALEYFYGEHLLYTIIVYILLVDAEERMEKIAMNTIHTYLSIILI